MVTLKKIKELSRQIVREFHPERIVLFGSYASGNPTKDSDLDLLVVLPFRGRTVDKAVEMRLKIRPTVPVDLIVRTPEKVRERLAMNDPFLENVMKTGKVLYEAHHP